MVKAMRAPLYASTRVADGTQRGMPVMSEVVRFRWRMFCPSLLALLDVAARTKQNCLTGVATGMVFSDGRP